MILLDIYLVGLIIAGIVAGFATIPVIIECGEPVKVISMLVAGVFIWPLMLPAFAAFGIMNIVKTTAGYLK